MMKGKEALGVNRQTRQDDGSMNWTINPQI